MSYVSPQNSIVGPIEDINVMCDLESLGTKSGCVILSVALVPFHTKVHIEPLYVKIDVDSSLAAGLTYDEDTIKWWGTLPAGVFEESTNGTTSVHDAFNMIHAYVKGLPGNPLIHGTGSDFDNVILQDTFEHLGIECPWDHRQNACFRTLRRLFKNKVNYVKPAMSHSALEDAKAQAIQADRILTLFEDMLSLYEPKTTDHHTVKRLSL